ncbi:MAG: hydroxymethylglutaryl-CoA synthase [Candidatus Aenigmarchaeota archaeon]|nr:hydroxymethylglutaryl-CoA synthase [Candidatus Aenigmarchaeota archaeon]
MDIGIVGYGAYVPRLRIKVEEIAKVWGMNAESIKNGLFVEEKSVPDHDEDAITIAVAAARNALARAQIDPQEIGAVYVGSESHPYAVKSSSSVVGEAIGATPFMLGADLEWACKAGTSGIQMCMGLVKAGYIESGLAIGADTSQARPGDALEYTASAGGAAFVIGKKNLLAVIQDTLSYATDTTDFWRREGQRFPRHGSRFTGEPAYFKHVVGATQAIMEKANLKPADFDHVIFHMPNAKFPLRAAKLLGFTKEQIEPSLVVKRIGNTYSGSSPLGLTNVLDHAKPDALILLTSFGSGAGSDSFIIKTTNVLEKKKSLAPTTESYIQKKDYIDYGTYLKKTRLLVK